MEREPLSLLWEAVSAENINYNDVQKAFNDLLKKNGFSLDEGDLLEVLYMVSIVCGWGQSEKPYSQEDEDNNVCGWYPSNKPYSQEDEDNVFRTVKFLLDQLLDLHYNMDILQKDLDNCLMMAAIACRYRVCKLLIESGANANAQGEWSRKKLTILNHLFASETAIKVGSTEIYDICKLLIENGANINSRSVRYKSDLSYLVMAVIRQDYNLCQFLIEQGVYVNEKGDCHGNTALHYALRYKNKSIESNTNEDCCHMISACFKSCNNIHFHECVLCMDYIDLRNDEYKIVELLLENKADMESLNDTKETCLLIAARAKNYEFSKLLIEKGANVNVSDNNGSSVLHLAVKCNIQVIYDDRNICKVLELFIENKADLLKRDKYERTCLMVAVLSGFRNAVELLIKAGGDVNYVNPLTGNTVLHYAVCTLNSLHIVELLLKNGANAITDNLNGDDVLKLACIKSSFDVISLLSSQYSAERLVDAYKLYGCMTVLRKKSNIFRSILNQMEEAVPFWEKSIRLQLHNPEVCTSKDQLGSCTKLAFKDVVEIQTLEELEDIKSNASALYVQIILIIQRMLGPFHPQLDRAAKLGNNLRMQGLNKSVILEVKKYLLEIRMVQNFTDSKNIDCIKDISNHFLSDQSEDYYKPSDVLEVMMFITKECKKSLQMLDTSVSLSGTLTSILHLFPSLFYAFFKVNPTPEEVKGLREIVSRGNLLACVPKGAPSGLLHQVCGYPDNQLRMYHCVKIVKLLLEAGCRVNAVDIDNRSPLHIVALRKDSLDTRTIDVLISHGGHIDQADGQRWRVYKLLDGYNGIDFFEHITLECLAAQVVKNSGIPYIGKVSKSLCDFIELH